MGQTIRRQPISFGIPATPNYKFLNITDFAGLHITDNPFTTKANTASDALNVYVDENNALSTRPRLEKVDELLLKINQPSMILIGAYPIKTGYLIHGYVGSNYMMYILRDGVISRVSGDIPKTECNVFEHNERLYLLTGDKYLTVIGNELKDVEGYIPLTRVAKRTEDGDSYSVYESLNVLSDKYRESYFWDGESDNIPKDINIIDVENNYFEKAVFYDKLQNGYDILYYDKTTQTFVCRNDNYELCNVKILDEYKDAEIKLRSLRLYDANKPRMAKNKPYLVYGLLTNEKIIGVSIYDCSGEDNIFIDEVSGQKSYIIRDTSSFSDIDEIVDYGFSPNASYLWVKVKQSLQIGNIINITYSLRLFTVDYVEKKLNPVSLDFTHLYTDYFEYVVFSEDESKAWALFTTEKNGIVWSRLAIIKFNINTKTTVPTPSTDARMYFKSDTILHHASGTPTTMVVGNDGTLYMAFVNTLTANYYDDMPYKTLSFNVTPKNIQLDENNDRLFFTSYTKSKEFIEDIAVVTKLSEFKSFYSLHLKFAEAKNLFLYNSPEYIITQNSRGIGFYLYKYSIEPLIIATKKLTNTHNDYSKWVERREDFLKSFLTVRFDNNIWFSSNNTLYRSLYNDPTYVSMTSYTNLGDGSSEITGFNIAGDDLLIAYKKERLYLIQPHSYTINSIDYYDYIYTETKNTVGNEAYGNAIVTTLSEMPIQITRDGIYALNQLKNVQSSDRISVLISEKINKKWLNETDEAILSCKTLNRLYWTYFILNDNNITKIYLLDNRTSSWYYWELPIVTLKAYVNDNKTTFIDPDGNVYELKTNDTFNPYNPEETQYYDDGKKLIKWYWQSQILPLGTINYSKRLVNTTFIVSDTDDSDEYGLNYSFKIYRKLVSESNTTTISNNLNYVQSVTKKTMIPRFNFLQIKLSNIEEDDENNAFNNNKFRLIGLGLKYVLLEGLY